MNPAVVAVGNRRHEVAADVTVDDVQPVDSERKGDEQREQAASSPAHFRRQEVLDAADESPSGLAVEGNWLFAHTQSPQ